ncbi:AAA family ATPase [Pseudoroseomonas wenyumeiae]
MLDRRKKVGAAALLGADGQPLPPASLARLTGPADRALLDRLFALDTEKLRAGGQALLASGGALAEALLQAAGGMRQARDLRQALEGERDRLAPLRKSAQRPFYLALDRLAASRRLLKEKLVRPEAWLQRDEALAEATRRHEAAHQASRDAAAAIHRMERARRIRPLLARLDMAQAWLAAHPGAPHLPADLRDRLSAALRSAEQAAEALNGLQRRHADLLQQASALRPDAALLAAAEAIRALQETAGAAARAQKDLPGAEAALRAVEARVEEHLAALGLPGPTAGAAARLPAPLPLQQARRLAEAHARHAALLAELPGRIASQEAVLATALRELEQLPRWVRRRTFPSCSPPSWLKATRCASPPPPRHDWPRHGQSWMRRWRGCQRRCGIRRPCAPFRCLGGRNWNGFPRRATRRWKRRGAPRPNAPAWKPMAGR